MKHIDLIKRAVLLGLTTAMACGADLTEPPRTPNVGGPAALRDAISIDTIDGGEMYFDGVDWYPPEGTSAEIFGAGTGIEAQRPSGPGTLLRYSGTFGFRGHSASEAISYSIRSIANGAVIDQGTVPNVGGPVREESDGLSLNNWHYVGYIEQPVLGCGWIADGDSEHFAWYLGWGVKDLTVGGGTGGGGSGSGSVKIEVGDRGLTRTKSVAGAFRWDCAKLPPPPGSFGGDRSGGGGTCENRSIVGRSATLPFDKATTAVLSNSCNADQEVCAWLVYGEWDSETGYIYWWDEALFCWNADGVQTAGPMGVFKSVAGAKGRTGDAEPPIPVDASLLLTGPLSNGDVAHLAKSSDGKARRMVIAVDTTKASIADVVAAAHAASSLITSRSLSDRFVRASLRSNRLNGRALQSDWAKDVVKTYQAARRAPVENVENVGTGRALPIALRK